MENFVFNNTAELVFGKDTEQRIPELLQKYGGTNVLLHSGGNSAEKSGLLPKIRKYLNDAEIPFTELSGVVSNPRLSLVRVGIDIAKQKKCDFILAVGGGSVIDSAKAIAAGYYLDDVWEHCFINRKPIERALPVACVLTIPAAGSESSTSTVITNEETNQKRGFGSPLTLCKFSVINPLNCSTVPDFHLASGIADMLGHIFERYFSLTPNTELTDAMGEAAMRTIIEQGKKVMADRTDMNALAEIVLAGTIAHNNILGIGRVQDWASHRMEHELSAKWDITHGSGLAVIYPAWLKFVYANADEQRLNVLNRFAKNVFGFIGPTAIKKTISALEEFYKTIGMPTRLSELDITADDDDIAQMAEKCLFDGPDIGNFYRLTKNDIIKIYSAAR
jgi:alcohol dehydrogenase YqhD (iron-dependent ADH family)